MKEIAIPVSKDRVHKFEDPTGCGHDKVFALVRVRDLPIDMPTDVNPRNQNTRSKVAHDIADGLTENSNAFHILNRGIVITAKATEISGGFLRLDLGNGGNYGVIDGGHTYAVIREQMEPFMEKGAEQPEFLDSFVQLEVLTNIRNGMIVDVARARNTSAQVKAESLSNLEGSFDWIKSALARQSFAEKISYKENEPGLPIDVREVVAFATMFHPSFEESENPPVVSYSSKGTCLELFVQQEMQEGYDKLRQILPDVLKLYDFIHLRMASIYTEVGGLTGVTHKEKKGDDIKLGKVKEVRTREGGFPLHYMDAVAEFKFPDGWLYPIVAAMRGLVSYKGNAKWKTDPFKYFDKYGKKLVIQTLEAAKSYGRNPNAVGKSKQHWTALHDRVIAQYSRLLGIDMEKEVVLN